MVMVPAKQMGWMSEFSEKLNLPVSGNDNEDSCCEHTGVRYVLTSDELKKV